jgi:trans-aconitate methyltransferase
MTVEEHYSINRYHKNLITENGNSGYKAVGWKSEMHQQKRFEVLAQIGDITNCSLLDVGCGNGAFRKYMEDYEISFRQYIGIDINDSLLDSAIGAYAHLPNTLFLKGDFTTALLPATDYIVASGAMSYYSSDEQFLEKAIGKLFDSCFIGLGVNLLSAVDDPSGFLRAYKADEILAVCNKISKNVVLQNTYLQHDFTIFMYH